MKDQDKRLALFAAFALGQLQALHSDHRINREFPDVLKGLPLNEIRRGRREGERWLAELEARQARTDLPAYVRKRGAAARIAQLFGDTA